MDKCMGLVGTGYWGKNILRNLYEIGVLNTACDFNVASLNAFKQKYPDVKYTSSFGDMLENPEIKAVALATPAVTHYELARKTLMAGRDVFVEKPLALTVEQGSELVDIAKGNNRVLMVGHILYYHPAIRKLKTIVSSGKLGKIFYIYSNRLNIGKVRTEENILWSFAPHDISVMLLLAGEEPEKVTSFGGSYVSRSIYDTTLTTLEFSNGLKGHIFVSWLHPFKEQKLIVVGSDAMVVFDDVSDEKLLLYPHKIEWQDGRIPVALREEGSVIPVESGEPLRLELEHFVECVNKRAAPMTDGNEGLRVLKVLERAEKHLGVEVDKNSSSMDDNIFAHPTAVLDDKIAIGKGTKIWHFSHILKGSTIGENCTIGQNVMIGPEVKIGNGCKIQNNVSIYKGVTLEDGVFCGPSCVFTNVYTPRAFVERKNEFRETIVKKGATIGANATVVCGNSIGKYAMVGAGAVVKADVPDYAVVAGVPAKRIGWACRCGEVLKEDSGKFKCKSCGCTHFIENGEFIPERSDEFDEKNTYARS